MRSRIGVGWPAVGENGLCGYRLYELPPSDTLDIEHEFTDPAGICPTNIPWGGDIGCTNTWCCKARHSRFRITGTNASEIYMGSVLKAEFGGCPCQCKCCPEKVSFTVVEADRLEAETQCGNTATVRRNEPATNDLLYACWSADSSNHVDITAAPAPWDLPYGELTNICWDLFAYSGNTESYVPGRYGDGAYPLTNGWVRLDTPGPMGIRAKCGPGDSPASCLDLTVTTLKIDIEQAETNVCGDMPAATLNLTSESYWGPSGVTWTSSPPGLEGVSFTDSVFTFNPSISTGGTYTVSAWADDLPCCAATATVNVYRVEILDSGEQNSDDCLSPPSGAYLYWRTTPAIGSPDERIAALKIFDSQSNMIWSVDEQKQTDERFWYGKDNSNNWVEAGTYYAQVQVSTTGLTCQSQTHGFLVFYARMNLPTQESWCVHDTAACAATVEPEGTTGTWEWYRSLGVGGQKSIDGFADNTAPNTTFARSIPDSDVWGKICVGFERPSGGSYGDGKMSDSDSRDFVVFASSKIEARHGTNVVTDSFAGVEDPIVALRVKKGSEGTIAVTGWPAPETVAENDLSAHWFFDKVGGDLTFTPDVVYSKTRGSISCDQTGFADVQAKCCVSDTNSYKVRGAVLWVDIDQAETNICCRMTNATLNLTSDSYWDNGTVEWKSEPEGLGDVGHNGTNFWFDPSASVATSYVVTAWSSALTNCMDTATARVWRVEIAPTNAVVCSDTNAFTFGLTNSYWEGSSVVWTSAPAGLSPEGGEGATFTITPSNSVATNYTITAYIKDLTNCASTATLTVLKVDLDVDSDRNGTVDGTDAEDAAETNTPAIIVVNNDDDDGKAAPQVDCSDNIVNGTEDVDDLAELVIRSIPTLPTGWKAVLSVSISDAEHIRIFDGRTATATARIGPAGSGLSNEYEIPNISLNLTYGIEATEYANATYAGTTTVAFIVRRTDDSEFARDEIKMKVAPFLLLPSTRPAEKIYVLDADTNFVAQLKAAVGASKVVEVPSATYPDVWVQDEVEIGYVQRPASSSMSVVWDLPRDGALDNWPDESLRGTNFGFFAEGTRGGASAEFGGNLECTPPVTVGGTEYNFGRAMVSTTMDSSLTQFIQAQGIQAPIVKLNVDWLLVGHVDEAVAFVQSGSDFKVLIADTACAVDLLKDLNTEDAGTANGGTSNLLSDASKTWTANSWQDGFVRITAGGGSGQVRQIASNTATSVVPKTAWTTPPGTNSQYEVVARSAYRCLFFEGDEDLGVVSLATATTLTDAAKTWTANTWAGGYVRIVAGTGSGQDPIEISGNTSAQLTLSGTWATTPDTTTRYVIVQKSRKRIDGTTFVETPALVTVREKIADVTFTNFNGTCQTHLDNIRSQLKTDLVLSDSDFVEIPTLFVEKTLPTRTGAVAYTPGMVNLLVDGTTLVSSKPFGPHDGGVDVFESDVNGKLSGYTMCFVDDWDQYHRWDGEVHCGTNAKRMPPSTNWWE